MAGDKLYATSSAWTVLNENEKRNLRFLMLDNKGVY